MRMRRPRPRALVALVVLAVLAGTANSVWRSNHALVTRLHVVASPDLPSGLDGFRIVQVTDLHEARFGTGQRALLDAIRAAEPDLILFTGDYGAEHAGQAGAAELTTAHVEPLREILEGLPAGVPAHYIFGNWEATEWYGGPPDRLDRITDAFESHMVSEIGWGLPIEHDGAMLWLTRWHTESWESTAAYEADLEVLGRITGKQVPHSRLIERARAARAFQLADWGRDGYVVAVSHRPLSSSRQSPPPPPGKTTEYSTSRPVDADLAISGHTHGGQWRLPALGGVIEPDTRRLFPGEEVLAGLRRDATGRATIISTGLGAGGPIPVLRFRWGVRPELTVIELKRS